MSAATPILDLLRVERVFYISPSGGGFAVNEACDDYFGVILTKTELIQLSVEIAAIANG